MILLVQQRAEIAIRSLGVQTEEQLWQALHRLVALQEDAFKADPGVHEVKLPGDPQKTRYMCWLSAEYRAIGFLEDRDTLVVEDIFSRKRLQRMLPGLEHI